MILRATSFLIPPGKYLAGEMEGYGVIIGHSLEWPGDPDVIRCDRNLGDKREDAIQWFMELIFDHADILNDVPRTDCATELFNQFRREERQAPGQVSLF